MYLISHIYFKKLQLKNISLKMYRRFPPQRSSMSFCPSWYRLDAEFSDHAVFAFFGCQSQGATHLLGTRRMAQLRALRASTRMRWSVSDVEILQAVVQESGTRHINTCANKLWVFVQCFNNLRGFRSQNWVLMPTLPKQRGPMKKSIESKFLEVATFNCRSFRIWC